MEGRIVTFQGPVCQDLCSVGLAYMFQTCMVQGDTSSCLNPPVDIDAKVVF